MLCAIQCRPHSNCKRQTLPDIFPCVLLGDQSSRDFLEAAIRDYNATFNTNYDTSSDKFQNYYKDLSLRVKNREIDLLIVVNMFLTGFDATTLQ
jgi:type I site-specific restriction-modification system R (restriction) subunit